MLIQPIATEEQAGAGGQRPLLSLELFRWLWLATLVANIGNAMGSVGAGWLMTSLSPSPLMVALVQAATTLPIALLALPGGTLADLVDRRRMLLVATGLGTVPALILSAAAASGEVSPELLLAMTAAGGCGIALCAPAFLAVTGDIVPRPLLPRAIGFGSISNSITRAAGPLLGGLIIAEAGTEWVFLADGLSALGILVVLRKWTPDPKPRRYPPEHLLSAFRTGFRYVHLSTQLHSALVRSLLFFACASALWSLLPLLARRHLGLDATGYGLLLGAIGTGAVCGSLALPSLGRLIPLNRLLWSGPCLLAGAGIAIAFSDDPVVGFCAALPAGFAWSIMASSLQAAVQMGAAAWVGARALGIFLMVAQGATTAGAIAWGAAAGVIGVPGALLLASVVLVAGLAVAGRYPLAVSPGDFTPALQWVDPLLDRPVADDEGPVLVTIEYRVRPAQSDMFTALLERLGRVRKRDGAINWGSWIDAADRSRVVETFTIGTWVEHLRQHERFTHEDRLLQNRLLAMHDEASKPLVRHWIAPAPSRPTRQTDDPVRPT